MCDWSTEEIGMGLKGTLHFGTRTLCNTCTKRHVDPAALNRSSVTLRTTQTNQLHEGCSAWTALLVKGSEIDRPTDVYSRTTPHRPSRFTLKTHQVPGSDRRPSCKLSLLCTAVARPQMMQVLVLCCLESRHVDLIWMRLSQ